MWICAILLFANVLVKLPVEFDNSFQIRKGKKQTNTKEIVLLGLVAGLEQIEVYGKLNVMGSICISLKTTLMNLFFCLMWVYICKCVYKCTFLKYVFRKMSKI